MCSPVDVPTLYEKFCRKLNFAIWGVVMKKDMNTELQNSKNNESSLIYSSAAEYLKFVATEGESETSVEMRYEDENIWLTQKMMAGLYDVSVPAINQHLKRIFSDNELEESSVVKYYLITAADGKNYNTTIGSRSQKFKIHRSDRKTAFWIAGMRFSFWGVAKVPGTKNKASYITGGARPDPRPSRPSRVPSYGLAFAAATTRD